GWHGVARAELLQPIGLQLWVRAGGGTGPGAVPGGEEDRGDVRAARRAHRPAVNRRPPRPREREAARLRRRRHRHADRLACNAGPWRAQGAAAPDRRARAGGWLTEATSRRANQPPPLVDYNLFEADAPLRESLEREDASWAHHLVHDLGALAGTEQAIDWGFQANANPPRLRTHDRFGNRIDEVEFHPAWHELMTSA